MTEHLIGPFLNLNIKGTVSRISSVANAYWLPFKSCRGICNINLLDQKHPQSYHTKKACYPGTPHRILTCFKALNQPLKSASQSPMKGPYRFTYCTLHRRRFAGFFLSVHLPYPMPSRYRAFESNRQLWTLVRLFQP